MAPIAPMAPLQRPAAPPPLPPRTPGAAAAATAATPVQPMLPSPAAAPAAAAVPPPLPPRTPAAAAAAPAASAESLGPSLGPSRGSVAGTPGTPGTPTPPPPKTRKAAASQPVTITMEQGTVAGGYCRSSVIDCSGSAGSARVWYARAGTIWSRRANGWRAGTVASGYGCPTVLGGTVTYRNYRIPQKRRGRSFSCYNACVSPLHVGELDTVALPYPSRRSIYRIPSTVHPSVAGWAVAALSADQKTKDFIESMLEKKGTVGVL